MFCLGEAWCQGVGVGAGFCSVVEEFGAGIRVGCL